MSYIDTFDHEFIGYFGGLPIYHPLVIQQGIPDDAADFGCTPEHLVIGGGGGENPGIVVRDPAYAVARFLSQWLIWCEENDQKFDSANKQVFDRWDSILLNDIPIRPWPEVFNFAGWTVRDYARFAELCSSTAFWMPFSASERSAILSRTGLQPQLESSCSSPCQNLATAPFPCLTAHESTSSARSTGTSCCRRRDIQTTTAEGHQERK